MILHLTLLLVFQLAGEVLRNTFGLTLPGPVIGMALLVVFLIAVPKAAEAVRATVQGFLGHLSLLFVPAGVGIVGHFDKFGSEGIGIALAIIVSTVLAIVTGALVFTAVARWVGAPDV